MKGKNQNKCYGARVVMLIIVFNPLLHKSMDWFLYDNGLRQERVTNIYKYFIQSHFSNMLITNRYVATNYCLNNSVINILTTLLRRIFIERVFKAKIQCKDLQLFCFIKRGRKLSR